MIRRLTGFFKKIFHWFLRKQEEDPERVVHERWQTRFSPIGRKRLLPEKNEKYEASIQRGAFILELKKPSLFAWITSRLFRHADFYIEAEIAFDDCSGYSSTGFVFRHLSEENFYCFLVSQFS